MKITNRKVMDMAKRLTEAGVPTKDHRGKINHAKRVVKYCKTYMIPIDEAIAKYEQHILSKLI